ncbi:hypothetical protein HanIR_Chr04g0202261 [Helianthus annuus]|nr:hypothetical protein HanIR_Chr04g0202261 [Helianthus annuus]
MPIGFWVESICCRKPEQEQQRGCLVWVLMVTKQGFASYIRSAVHLRRAGFRGWSASHRQLPEKNIRCIHTLCERE